MSAGDLPFTVPRRRLQKNSNNLENKGTEFSVGFGSEEEGLTIQEKGTESATTSLFSSLIANRAASLWNSAQNTLSPSSSWISLRQTDPTSDFLNKDQSSLSALDNYYNNTNSCTRSESNNNFCYTFTIEDMPCRDRTIEFKTAAKSAQMKWQTTANGHIQQQQKPHPKHIIQQSIQFNQLAKRIGRDLSRTCAKMEQLAELAKRRSLFDDRIIDVERLTQIIKQDVTGLNNQIGTLQAMVKERAADQSNGLILRPQGQNHSRTVVVGLQSKLATISNEFKQVLEIRTENMKQQQSRREIFGQSRSIPSGMPPDTSSARGGSLLYEDVITNGSSSVTVDMDALGQQNNINNNNRQSQLVLMDQRDVYVQSRSTTMETIESSIAELGTIFRQLASLVSEQGETITRIDSNVEETGLHVEAAHMELLKYFRNMSGNRWLMIKIFGVLLIFFIVFIVFMT